MTGPVNRPQPSLWPREHGAWGLLLQPFLAGAVLAGHWTWLLLPALGALLLGFALREPLVILARQAFVWRDRTPLSPRAFRWLGCELAALAVCFSLLAAHVPPVILAAFAAVGATLTPLAVWVTIRNRQRSRLFQAASAAALGSASLFAVAVCTGTIPGWAWTLWAVLSLHGVAAILVVHARLARRIGLRSGAPPSSLARQYAFQIAQIPAAAALAFVHPALALPPLFTLAAHIMELRRLTSIDALGEPLSRVGFRTLAIAILHLLLTMACFWPAIHG
ncbi:MAG: hypothetical protein C0504_04265 [Candidatus Solibacter sp.]|nr:hypothetical protein [Candidatus Solibacter sp.]